MSRKVIDYSNAENGSSEVFSGLRPVTGKYIMFIDVLVLIHFRFP